MIYNIKAKYKMDRNKKNFNKWRIMSEKAVGTYINFFDKIRPWGFI